MPVVAHGGALVVLGQPNTTRLRALAGTAARRMRWFGGELARQFVRHQCLTSAAALTYTTLLALVPLMTVTYLVFSAFPELAVVRAAVEEFLVETFVPNASAALIDKLGEFSARATELGIVSVAVLAVFALLALARMESAFNAIWGAPAPRTGMQRFLFYWAALTVGPPLLVGALLATSYLYALPLVTDLDAWGARERLLDLAPDLAVVATFTWLYYAMPNTRVVFRHALIAGLLTMLLFGVAKWAFAVFVERSTTALVYGAFAALPFFLVWIYMVWLLALGGAVFARTLSLSPPAEDDRRAPPPPLLLQCARALAVLRTAHERGEAVATATLAEEAGLRETARERVLGVLARERLVRSTDDGRLTLGRSLGTVTLLDLHRWLPEALPAGVMEEENGAAKAVAGRLRAVAACGERELNVSLEAVLAEGDAR